MSSTFIIHEHTIPGSHIREYARATANSQDEPLMIHVKRYVPEDYTNPRKGDVTIVGAHANGFPKVRTAHIKDWVEHIRRLTQR